MGVTLHYIIFDVVVFETERRAARGQEREVLRFCIERNSAEERRARCHLRGRTGTVVTEGRPSTGAVEGLVSFLVIRFLTEVTEEGFGVHKLFVLLRVIGGIIGGRLRFEYTREGSVGRIIEYWLVLQQTAEQILDRLRREAAIVRGRRTRRVIIIRRWYLNAFE